MIHGGSEGPFRRVLDGADDQGPFVLFAVLLPLRRPAADGVGGVDRRSVGGMEHSIKASGCPDGDAAVRHHLPVDLVAGLPVAALSPTSVVAIHVLIRYVDVVADQYAHAGRAAGARHALNLPRGRRSPVIASGLAALFVGRTERGERSRLALVSRGCDNDCRTPPVARARSWAFAAVLPVCAATSFSGSVWWRNGDRTARLDCTSRRHRGPAGRLISIIAMTVALLGPNGEQDNLGPASQRCAGDPGRRVRVAGRRVGAPRCAIRARRRVGMVFQDPDDQLFMPAVAQDVAFGRPTLTAHDVSPVGWRALDAVGMGTVAQRAPHHLSFGQRRRWRSPRFLNMDPESWFSMSRVPTWIPPVVEGSQGPGSLDVTMLMVTRLPVVFAWQLCPHASSLCPGRIRYDGSHPRASHRLPKLLAISAGLPLRR